MALETSMNFEEEVKAFDYEYKEEQDDVFENTSEEDAPQDEKVSSSNLFEGLGGFVESNASLLFFFLILVIIFNGSGTFSESNESLLFFFLILVILFNQFY